ncbi:MAG: hypothetical protein FWF51_07310 [Chitinivibrionia bacterium]|nr:hypothetical protein [Chitinivibrionia bacterium]
MKIKCFLAIFFAVLVSFANKNDKNEFLSQDFIDTTIQSAYYGFVAASRESSGGGVSQSRAIQNAKSVVSELKKKAENDPNKRYILFRLSELEAQISLEEEEVRLKNMYAKVQKINELVEIFNKEVLQPRPNFANLHTLYNRMSIVDVSKMNEFAGIINQKMKSVTATLKNSFSNNINSGDYKKAEVDYNYAIENLKYLEMGNREIEDWRKRIQAKKDADYLKENIDNRVAFINGIVRENRLSEAKRHIEVLNFDLKGASALLNQSFIASTRMKLDGLSASIDKREDSLIQYGYSLVTAKRYKEASAYLSNVLSPAGVDRVKAAGIDRAIIEAEGGNVKRADYKTSLSSEHISEETQTAMGAAMNARMKQKADSIRLANEAEELKAQKYFEKKNAADIKKFRSALSQQAKLQQKSDAFLEGVLQTYYSGKQDAAVKKFKAKQTECFMNATPKTYYDVKTRINTHTGASNYDDFELNEVMRRHKEQSPEAKQVKAEQLIGEIYERIERKQLTEAYRIYYLNKPLLSQFAYPEAYVSMRKALVKAYSKEMNL